MNRALICLLKSARLLRCFSPMCDKDAIQNLQREMVRTSSFAHDALVICEKVDRMLEKQCAENERHHDEMFTRLRKMEIEVATAKGAKAGVIFSFSLFWAVVLAAVSGAIGYFSK